VMMQGLSPRGEVRRKHGTNVRVDGQKPNRRRPYRTSGQLTAKSKIHQGAKRRFGDCARKVTELTPGDLFRVASATEVVVRRPDRGAEVSIGHSTQQRRRPEREGVVSRP
jgi:hypothetical protein